MSNNFNGRPFTHGNDATGAVTLFRRGQELAIKAVYRTARSSEVITFLTTKEAAERPRASYHFDQWGEDEVMLVLARSEGDYLPAEPGDEIRIVDGGLPAGYRWRHVISQEDVDRGWISCGHHWGTRSGRLEHPVFLRPRRMYRRGNAEYASKSAF